jgi:KDO2-lipid IV(A) lauroyltransferase
MRIVAAHSLPPWSSFLAPRFWPTWAGIAALCLTAWLPFRLRMATGNLLGRLTWRFGKERRYITAININLCFPALSAAEQAALVQRCFIESGIGLIETATGWVRPPAHFLDRLVLMGTEHLAAALARQRGVLMLGAHYSTLDFGANLLSVHYPFAVTYRPHKNPLFDAFMLRGRLRNCNGVFDRHDIRGALRHLKRGKILWYAPDQDYGPEQAVFVPFFGHTAATITAASRFAAFNQSPVVLVRQQRIQGGRYVLEFTPLSPPLPSGDDARDACLINAALERAIRVEPAQYLWMHKRFKTQQHGKPHSPYIHIRTPDKNLSEAQYAGLVADAQPYGNDGVTPWLRLPGGLLLREFPNHRRGLWRQRHPALRLDSISKDLRSAGIATVTTDNIFRSGSRKLTAVTCFPPAGSPLAIAQVSPAAAAGFLARLHNSGFHFAHLANTDLMADADHAIGILEPLTVCQVPGSAAWHQRLQDLQAWQAVMPADAEATDTLLGCYLANLRPRDAAGMRALLARHGGLADKAVTSNQCPVQSGTGNSGAT